LETVGLSVDSNWAIFDKDKILKTSKKPMA
jgi:hypothetical protein